MMLKPWKVYVPQNDYAFAVLCYSFATSVTFCDLHLSVFLNVMLGRKDYEPLRS